MAQKHISKTDKFIIDFCKDNKISFMVDFDLDVDDGLCYPDVKEIHLSQKYTSNWIKLAAFFHEVGHIIVYNRKIKPQNDFDCEFYSWFEAMKLHMKHFKKPFSKSQSTYMLQCLDSHSKCTSEFKKLS